MPYAIGDKLTNIHGASKYSGNAKRAFIHAFNSCHEKGGEEARCYKIGHFAAKQAGSKKGPAT